MSELGGVIVAAGSGVRMDGVDKLFTPVGGRAILARAIRAFELCPAVSAISVVVSETNLKRARELVQDQNATKVVDVSAGGPRRQDSVMRGLTALGECDYVAVHDGARPLVTPELISLGWEVAKRTGAAVPALPISETVKEAADDGRVLRTVDRSHLYTVQTPQVFRYETLLRAHRQVKEDVTDDAAMLEALGEPVIIFPGLRTNVKITTPQDIELVEALLLAERRARARG